MTRHDCALALTVLLLVASPVVAQEHEATDGPQSTAALEGDRELLRQTMIDARIASDRSRPGLTQWAQDVGLAFSQWLGRWMDRVLPGFNRWLVPFIEPATKFLLTLLAVVLFVFLVRFIVERWRLRESASSEPIQHLDADDEVESAAREWEDELRRHLGRGDVAAATQALWWWLAGRLAADRAEPSWTSRELVVRAGRRDLLADVHRLDRMMYDVRQPSADDIRRLWGDLREAVG